MPLGYNNDDGAQALDQQQEVDFRRGWQVVNASAGSNVVTAGTGAYEVDVAAGDINTPTGTVTCSAATLDLQSLVDPDLPRIVIVYRDASGVAQTLAGTPAAKQPTGETSPGPIYQPAPDAFSTTDGVVLATVLLEAAASSVGSAQIRDRRMPASLNVDSAEVGSLNADRTSFKSGDSTADPIRIDGSTGQIANIRTQFTTGVNTTASEVFDASTVDGRPFRGGLIAISGVDQSDASIQFTDIISYVRTGGTVQHGDDRGNVATRSYTFTTSAIELSMGSGDYDVSAVGLGADPK